LPFIERLYGNTRQWEMDLLVDWSDEEKAAFIKQQHNAQHSYYQQVFPAARYELILQDGEPIGRLYVDRREDEHRIIDISLLDTHRGQGIGGKIMQDLLDEAVAAGKLVRIHVEHNNPAMHLYDRLGFKKIEEQGVYWLMEWEPNQ
jgi:ribosomal protein S18 acetylase RimI-like enzyme